MERNNWCRQIGRMIIRPLFILRAQLSDLPYYDEVSDRVYCGRDVWVADAWLALHYPQSFENDEDDKEPVEA